VNWDRGQEHEEHQPMDVLINLIVAIITQCTHISDHHLVYIQFLLISYTSIKLKNKEKQLEIIKDSQAHHSYMPTLSLKKFLPS
jgi:hypothetical protein